MAELVAAERCLRRSMRRQRVFIDRMNPLEVLRSEPSVKEHYRFYTPTIYFILGEILDDIIRPTKRSCALPPLITLCAALRFYATGGYYTLIGQTIHICKASLCRCIKRVTKALLRRRSRFIKWPVGDALDEMKSRFYEIAGKKIQITTKVQE